MIRNVVIHISSQHSAPAEVAWSIRESSWSVGARREVTYGAGTFPVPSGGLNSVILAAAEAVRACAEARQRAEALVTEVRQARAGLDGERPLSSR